MNFITTTAYCKIKSLKKKHRIIQGSQGASKTYSICQDYHLWANCHPRSISTIVAATYPLLRDGAIQDMDNIVTSYGYAWEAMYKKQDKEIIYPNGAKIQFRNIDSKDFHKGKGARRDRLFINEGNRGITWTSIEQMITRSDFDVTIDFNPDHEFWAHEEFLNAGRDDVDFLILTYKDNQCLKAGERKEIERRIEASKQPGASAQLQNWVRIYAYGELGTYSDRQIYNYQFSEIPDTAKKINSGMDFGSSPDPTILVELYIDGANLYADEIFCENNLLPEKIKGAERMSVVDKMVEIGYPKGQLIIGDTSGKVSIIDMRKQGFNILAVKKNIPVIDGISKVNSYNLFITTRSINIKKGIESWFRKVDHNGKIIPEPEGHEPDGLAAIRYGIMFYIQK